MKYIVNLDVCLCGKNYKKGDFVTEEDFASRKNDFFMAVGSKWISEAEEVEEKPTKRNTKK